MTEKLPNLTPEDVERIAALIPEHMAERRKDEEDKRLKRGKYAPETGSCVSCSGTVRAVVRVRIRAASAVHRAAPSLRTGSASVAD